MEEINNRIGAENVTEERVAEQEATAQESAATESMPETMDTTETTEAAAEETEKKAEFSFDSLKPKIKPIWKIVFAVVLLLCIGASLYFSFNALSLDTYEFDEVDGGWQLTGFHNDGTSKEITIDYVMVKKGVNWVKDESRPITSVREYALCCDNTIEKINIGSSVKNIENLAFYSCKSLQAILVDESNESYLSENGILYTKDKSVIIQFPIAYVDYENNILAEADGDNKIMRYTVDPVVKKVGDLCFAYAKGLVEVNLPEGVETLGTLSFFKCESLFSFRLPDNVSVIGSDSFSYCKKLTYFFIPFSVTEIGHHAFYECSGLSEIDVARSERDFKNVKVGDYWKNSDLLNPISIRYCQERK